MRFYEVDNSQEIAKLYATQEPRAKVFSAIHEERKRQIMMVREQQIPIDMSSPFSTNLEKLAVVFEELSEVAMSVNRGPTSRSNYLYAELLGATACLVAWMEAEKKRESM